MVFSVEFSIQSYRLVRPLFVVFPKPCTIETMKHYLMICIFLFSSLSAQWVGAISLNKSATESVASMSSASTSSNAAMHHVSQSSHNLKNADESHDCCPSMQTTEVDTIAQCVHCGDNCQCENGQVCQHTSPLMKLSQQLLQTGPLSASAIISYSPILPSIALAPEFKPPQS